MDKQNDREGGQVDKNVRLRKLLPFIPVIGIILTGIYHAKYRDTGIENAIINLISATWQAVFTYGILKITGVI